MSPNILRVRRTLAQTAAAACLLVAPAAAAQTPELYEFDVAHAELDFHVRLVGFNRVRGTFEDYRGSVLIVGDDPLRSAVSLAINVASIRTGVDERDNHLRSDAFFDAARWPSISFTSHRIERDGASYAAVGPLTIRDVTREVRLPFSVTSPKGIDPFGNTRVSVAGRLVINRRDFGVVGPAFWNKAIGDSVEIQFEVPGRRWAWATLGWGSANRTSGGKAVLEAIEQKGVVRATDETWTLFTAHRGDTAYNWSSFEFRKAAGRLADQGKISAAIGVLELGARVAEALGSPASVSMVRAQLAELLLRDGNAARAAVEATAALRADSTNPGALLLSRLIGATPPG